MRFSQIRFVLKMMDLLLQDILATPASYLSQLLLPGGDRKAKAFWGFSYLEVE